MLEGFAAKADELYILSESRAPVRATQKEWVAWHESNRAIKTTSRLCDNREVKTVFWGAKVGDQIVMFETSVVSPDSITVVSRRNTEAEALADHERQVQLLGGHGGAAMAQQFIISSYCWLGRLVPGTGD